MTPEEAGVNAAKGALYYALMRQMPAWHEREAVKLYNVWGLGYQAGASMPELLWPQDIP
jgi:hypothetical protein